MPPVTRRTFSAMGLAALTAPAIARRPQDALTVNGPRLLRTHDALQAFGGTPDGGNQRVAFSPANAEALAWARQLLDAAGFRTSIDPAANLIASKPGREDRPPLMFGSHIDAVPAGGHYDGQVGSLAAIEVARTLADAEHRTRHPLEVVLFANEEGGKTGSRAMAGEVTGADLDLPTASGRTIGEGTRFLGGDPDRLDEVRRHAGDVAAFLELHVEQGAILDRDDLDIGIVEGIVGIKRWEVTVAGYANHAGTTPMDARRDAMVGAAHFIQMVHDTARTLPGRQVATVGRIAAHPGAPNVIPGRVELSLEVRDLAMETIDAVYDRIVSASRAIGEQLGIGFEFRQFYVSHAAPTDERLRSLVSASATDLGLRSMRMPSGAGHDAQSVAQFAPVGMIFVPSVDGISHSPAEVTLPDDMINGANVLLRTLLAADREDWAG